MISKSDVDIGGRSDIFELQIWVPKKEPVSNFELVVNKMCHPKINIATMSYHEEMEFPSVWLNKDQFVEYVSSLRLRRQDFIYKHHGHLYNGLDKSDRLPYSHWNSRYMHFLEMSTWLKATLIRSLAGIMTFDNHWTPAEIWTRYVIQASWNVQDLMRSKR